MPARKKHPRPPAAALAATLRGTLLVEQVSYSAPRGLARQVASGLDGDGTPYRCYASMSDSEILLVRDGRATRRVRLHDLVAAILGAGEEP